MRHLVKTVRARLEALYSDANRASCLAYQSRFQRSNRVAMTDQGRELESTHKRPRHSASACWASRMSSFSAKSASRVNRAALIVHASRQSETTVRSRSSCIRSAWTSSSARRADCVSHCVRLIRRREARRKRVERSLRKRSYQCCGQKGGEHVRLGQCGR